MTALPGYRLTDVPRERQRERLEIGGWGFVFSLRDSSLELEAQGYPWDRARGIEIADASRGQVGKLVANHASFEMQMRVPGGVVPTSGLTWVGVHPGHRRQGLLRAMIADHFSRSLARGEALSALYASETPIYQRFGYGRVGHILRMDIGRSPKLRDVPGAADLRVEFDVADADAHGDILRAVHRRMTRPGTIVDIHEALLRNLFFDAPEDREYNEPLRFVWVEDAEGPAAYALFVRRGVWERGQAAGQLFVKTWGAAHPAALHRLVSVISDVDLMVQCHLPAVAPDSPLLSMLEDPRKSMDGVDNIWVRVLDVQQALTARRFSADVDAVIELTDAMLPGNAGRWRIAASADGQPAVTRTDDASDLALDIRELSAAYLGGVSLVSLAGAGLVEEKTPGALTAVSRAFTADEAAACVIDF